MNSHQFRVGIIGTGVGLRTHAAGFHALGNVEIVGVVGRSIDRARMLLNDIRGDKALACSLDELLMRRPDLVCLTTPPQERQSYITKLADANVRLLVEKPVAVSGKMAQILYETYILDYPPVYVNFQLRGLPAFQAIANMIREGEFGHVYSIQLRERTSALRRSQIAAWQERQSTGGGQRLAMGCHLLDLGVYLVGASYEQATTEEEFGNMDTPRGSWLKADADVDDTADEVFRATLKAKGCWIDLFTTAIGTGPRVVQVDIEGTEGMASFAFRDGTGALEIYSTIGAVRRFTLMTDGELGRADGTLPTMNPSLFRVAFPNYAREIVDTINRESIGQNLASLEDGIANAKVLDRLIGRPS
jgi:predicted dehydrogenase